MAIDGNKFKAVTSSDRNLTPAKIEKRKRQVRRAQCCMAELGKLCKTGPRTCMH